ncbi:PRCC protein, partial [Atractosteus spatula]|nr:PRCC protein [Atractosteus spatula]
MSLVAYGSSDESDSEDPTESGAGPGRGAKTTGLFSSLPTPKNATPGSPAPSRSGPNWGASLPPPRDSAGRIGVHQGPDPAPPNQGPPRPEWSQENDPEIPNFQPPSRAGLSLPSPSGGLVFNLPKPKKRTEPVKIRIPEIERGEVSIPTFTSFPPSLEVEPQPATSVSWALAPEQLVPTPASLRINCNPKSFSWMPLIDCNATCSPKRAVGSWVTVCCCSYCSGFTSPKFCCLSAPRGRERSAGPSSARVSFLLPVTYYPQYQDPESRIQGPAQESYYQDYYGGGYYQEADPGLAGTEDPGSSSSSLIDDEAFRRLQGKRNQGKEEVKFLEIKGDDQLSGSQQWLTKAITEEKDQRKSFSKKKGDQPTGQQRRKHQITYLIHQAKERELELKNSWADNKLTRRQTQAKYGF